MQVFALSSFLQGRFVQGNLHKFIVERSVSYDLRVELNKVRRYSLLVTLVAFLTLLQFSYFGISLGRVIQNLAVPEVLPILGYYVVNLIIGPSGVILAQLGRKEIVRNNALTSVTLYVVLCVSVYLLQPYNSVLWYSLSFLMCRCLVDLRNAWSLKREFVISPFLWSRF